MADDVSSKQSSTKKSIKKADLTEADARKAAWDKAEKSLNKGKYEGALDLLRDVDSKGEHPTCLLYTSPSPRDGLLSRMPSSA